MWTWQLVYLPTRDDALILQKFWVSSGGSSLPQRGQYERRWHCAEFGGDNPEAEAASRGQGRSMD
jgi:hypothetical protein